MAQDIRHFLDLDQISSTDLRAIINAGHAMKKAGKKTPKELAPDGIEDDVLVLAEGAPRNFSREAFSQLAQAQAA